MCLTKEGVDVRKLFAILFIFLVVLAAGTAYVFYLLSPVDNLLDTTFTIENGMSLGHVVKLLKEQGAIRSDYAFNLVNRFLKLGPIKTGEYDVKAGMSTLDIVKMFEKGSVKTVRVTIPEGYNLKQIAKTYAEKGVTGEEEFFSIVNSPSEELLSGFPYDTHGNLEGFLFPDTYDFVKGTSAATVVKIMMNQFVKKMDSLLEKESSLSQYELIILASIVEREAKFEDERPRIAQVFLNRLKANIKLQSCATIQFLLPQPKERLLLKDLEIDSPYNTYKVYGLPPAPICCPGYASMKACVEPSGEDYLYFVAMDSGHHVFSKTYADHIKAQNSPKSTAPN